VEKMEIQGSITRTRPRWHTAVNKLQHVNWQDALTFLYLSSCYTEASDEKEAKAILGLLLVPKLEDVIKGPEKTSSPYCVIHDADVVQCKIWRQSTRQPFEAG
jgi:hypothetical protein